MNNEQIEPKYDEYEEKTIKIECSFTSYVTIHLKKEYENEDERYEDIEQNLKELKDFELIEECDNIEIEDWKEI